MAAQYGIQLGKLFFVGALSVIVTVALIVGLEALYYWQIAGTEASDGYYPPPAKLTALLNAQQARLSDYRVEDAEKGIVAIPIARAMELVVAELSHSNPLSAAGDKTAKEERDER